MHGAQDSSSFILLHEHSKVFKVIYVNCPGNVLSWKVIVRERSLSGKRPLPNTTEPSMCGGDVDVDLRQITLTTCYYYAAIVARHDNYPK